MNCKLAAAVAALWVLTLSLAAAQPHSTPVPPPPIPPKVNFVDLAERAGLTAKTEDGGDKTKRCIIGLGKATKADAIEIRWPSGLVQRLENVASNQIVRIRESIGVMKN